MAAEVPSTGLFSGFPVIGVDRIVKRTLISTAVVAVVGAVVAILVGHALVAPGLVIGLAMALVNHRVFQASAMRYITEEGAVRRKPFAGSVFARLGACTAVVLLLLFFARPVGWGAIGGLAVFQALLLLNAVVALLGYQREGQGGINA